MSPARLAGILEKLPKLQSPDLLVGIDTMDDSGVFRISAEMALVQTVDFFYPAVQDPRTFGRIVAANSLSDIWAMGAEALTAMNLLAFPAGEVPIAAIEELLIGGSEKLQEARVVLVGGHSMDTQKDFIYGMSVTGSVHPDHILTNSRLREGDVLILTKPLGTGVYCEAHSKDGLSNSQYTEFIHWMERLNKYSAEIFEQYDVSGMTDITGFGLLGHALPMARNCETTLVINESSVPYLSDIDLLHNEYPNVQVMKPEEDIFPWAQIDSDLSEKRIKLLTGAQTSGGLLAAVNESQAEIVIKKLRDSGDHKSSVIGYVSQLLTMDSGEPCYLKIKK